MKVYIAGPMSGVKDWNYPLFFEVAQLLKTHGLEPCNPAAHDGETLEEALANVGTEENPGHPWEWYIKRDLKMLLDCDAILMLPNWKKSRGASLEHVVATAVDIPVFQFSELWDLVDAK